jgi:tetratricopeptide (TPR) repeat protein
VSTVATQDERLAAIAAAAAAVLRHTPYHSVRAGDVAAEVRLPGETGRSAVWLYHEVRNRRVLVALAAAHAWRDFPGRAAWSGPGQIGSVAAARSAAATALAVIVGFHRAEQALMTQVGYGIGDISTAEKRQLAAGADVADPRWPDSHWGRVAAAAWAGRCDVFTDFLRPVLQDCAESVTNLAAAGSAAAMPAAAGHDLQRLSHAASHLGLAAARYGDRRSAADAWQLSRRVAEHELGHDVSRMARADANLATLAAEAGHGQRAGSVISGVFRTRLELLERRPDDDAAWRRLTVTARTRADIARVSGQVVESVRLAATLLADRRARLGDPAHADIAEARLVLGQALLAAGHPTAARRQLEAAADTRRDRFLAASYRVQEDLLWLVRATLVLEHPRAAAELLAGQAAVTDWFRDRVSFRLGYTARRLLALASGGLGRTEEAAAALLADRERLGDWPLDGGLDPLVADFDRALGEVALARGDFADALATLDRLARAEALADQPLPARGWTLVLLGRAADGLGEPGRAAECFGSVTELAAAGIDACHPVILTARYDEAVRRAARGDTGQAARLLEPLLDRTLLAHGRSALGEAHPLLARARALAGRLGITIPDPAAAIDEVSLDIDV